MVLDAKTGEVSPWPATPPSTPTIGWAASGSSTSSSSRRANYPLLNRAIKEAKGVGSTFKPIDAVAGSGAGRDHARPHVLLPGLFKVAGPHLLLLGPRRARHRRSVEAIAESCDVYFYNVGYKFYLRQGTELEDWARRLGLGSTTGIDIPGESTGLVPTPAWKRAALHRRRRQAVEAGRLRSTWPSARATCWPRRCSSPWPTRPSPTAATMSRRTWASRSSRRRAGWCAPYRAQAAASSTSRRHAGRPA